MENRGSTGIMSREMKRSTSRCVAAITLLWMNLAGVGSTESAERSQRNRRPRTPLQTVTLSLVHVGRGTGSNGAVRVAWLGTGFLVDDRCTIATAKHILRNVPDDEILIRMHDPEGDGLVTAPATQIYASADRDLSFLKVRTPPGQRCSSGDIVASPLAGRFDPDALNGKEVRILGYPVLEGDQPRDVAIVKQGIVASAELEWDGEPMLLLDLTGVPGFSGAPVILQETGEVIGVVFGPGRTERQYDLEWATPITVDDAEQAHKATRRDSRR